MHGNSLMVDGQPFVIGIEGGTLTVDGIAYQVELGESEAVVDGKTYRIEAGGMSIRAPAPPKKAVAKARSSTGAGTVTAMMPGAILRVLVAEEDSVQEGQVVVILEAMKMENEIHAHRSGKIQRVLVAVGDSVENGQPLVEIE
jgi:biotin carboxyl carrier protein